MFLMLDSQWLEDLQIVKKFKNKETMQKTQKQQRWQTSGDKHS